MDFKSLIFNELPKQRSSKLSNPGSSKEEEKEPRVLRKVRGDIDTLDDDEFLAADEGIAFNTVGRGEPSPAKPRIILGEGLIAGQVTQVRHKKNPSSLIMTPKGRNLEIKKIRSLSRGNDGLLGSKESSQTNLLNITL